MVIVFASQTLRLVNLNSSFWFIRDVNTYFENRI